jgi:hypothetical protein
MLPVASTMSPRVPSGMHAPAGLRRHGPSAISVGNHGGTIRAGGAEALSLAHHDPVGSMARTAQPSAEMARVLLIER